MTALIIINFVRLVRRGGSYSLNYPRLISRSASALKGFNIEVSYISFLDEDFFYQTQIFHALCPWGSNIAIILARCLCDLDGTDVFGFPSHPTYLSLLVVDPDYPLNPALFVGFQFWLRRICNDLVQYVLSVPRLLMFPKSLVFGLTSFLALQIWLVLQFCAISCK